MRLDPASAGATAARLLYDLVSIYTPPGREHEALPVIEEWASRLGLAAGLDRHGNIIVAPEDWNGSLPVVALASHVDTVPGMLKPVLEEGAVAGRGAVDAKGPLAAMIVGLSLAAAEGLECSAAVMALLGEEAESPGAWGLLASGEVPPFIVIGEPTGGDGVAIGYRGSLKLEALCTGEGGHAASSGEGAAWRLVEGLAKVKSVLEPSTLTVLRAGEAWNVAPSRAEAVIDKRFQESPTDALAAAADACGSLGPGCGCSRLWLLSPVRIPLASPVPRSLVAALRSEGVRPRVSVKQGTSDMNILYWAARSIAAYGPGDPRLAHTDRERVSMEELGRAARVYAAVVRRLCRGAWETLRS